MLPEPFVCTKGQGFHGPDDPLQDEPSDNHGETTMCALVRELSTRNHVNPQQPAYKDRATYSDLMLVCKTVHSEAAPLFFRKVTLFIRDPFQFATRFLRKLSIEKISSLRHLELSFADNTRRDHEPQMKIFKDLVQVFKTYRELRYLDSVTMTSSVDGRGRQINGEPSFIFRPVDNYDPHSGFYGYPGRVHHPATRTWMWKAGQVLLKTMGASQFELSQSVEAVYASMSQNQNEWKWRCEVPRVRLQRKQ